ncbi:hypothetical protein U9R90_12290 [Streptomyces sp. E11-3]|uniref:hypothetical protein n=1 Tax=Streptomyces sp. E11-3 TaxID=3110112 RepID=UPI0039802350
MSRNVEVYEALRSVSNQQLAAFCAACAERGSGLAQLGTPEQQDQLTRLLGVAWGVLSGGQSEESAVEVLEEAELMFDEDDPLAEDDPGSPEFLVAQAILLAVNAISVCLHPDPRRAEMSGQTLETILSSLDFRMSGQQAVFVRHGEAEPPVGRLQQLEQDAQHAFMESIIHGGGEPLDREALEMLRVTSAPVRDEITAAIAEVAELCGWDTAD